MNVKRIYMRHANVESPKWSRDLALKAIDTAVKAFDRACERYGVFNDEVMAAYGAVLGNIDMANTLFAISVDEYCELTDRAYKRKDSWEKVFKAQKLLDKSIDELHKGCVIG